MGYYATFYGGFTTFPIPDKVREKFPYMEYSVSKNKNTCEICFDGYDKYYEEEWIGKDGVLANIQPYVISGEVIFAGEDDCFWCYKYDCEKHGFLEGTGRVEYTFDKEVMRFE